MVSYTELKYVAPLDNNLQLVIRRTGEDATTCLYLPDWLQEIVDNRTSPELIDHTGVTNQLACLIRAIDARQFVELRAALFGVADKLQKLLGPRLSNLKLTAIEPFKRYREAIPALHTNVSVEVLASRHELLVSDSHSVALNWHPFAEFDSTVQQVEWLQRFGASITRGWFSIDGKETRKALHGLPGFLASYPAFIAGMKRAGHQVAVLNARKNSLHGTELIEIVVACVKCDLLAEISNDCEAAGLIFSDPSPESPDEIAKHLWLPDIEALPECTKPLAFNQTLKHPYYIFAPDYRQNSAGIRCLHYLCHTLNESGYEAYIASTNVTNPYLRTPLLTGDIREKHLRTGRIPIAVYPEVVSGNPFQSPIVARWLLNRPGLLGGESQYAPDDLLFCHDSWVLPEGMKAHLLRIPSVDLRIFNNVDNEYDQKRSGFCYYANKYLVAGGKIDPLLVQDGISLGQDIVRTPAEIADILRRSEVLYCYEQTALIEEAIACGCPVIIKTSDYWERTKPAQRFLGVAEDTDPEAIALIKDEVARYPEIRSNEEQACRHLFEVFAGITQQAADRVAQCKEQPSSEAVPLPAGSAHDVAGGPSVADEQYQRWASKHTLEPIHAQLHAERMMLGWHSQPKVVMMMPLPRTKLELAFKSISSLQLQLYKHWQLIFVADFDAPSDAFTQSDVLGWLQVDDIDSAEQLNQAYNAIIDAIPCDWICVLPPGTELEPNALLSLGDYISLHPGWHAIYSDHDEIAPDGTRDRPAFKPDFNLDYFRAFDYVGEAIWFRTEALKNAGGFAPYPGAECYDMLWRLHDHFGDRCIGHIAEPLFHFPAGGEEHSVAQSSRQVALECHLQRQGVNATVEPGLIAGTMRVLYPLDSSPLVSIIIPNKNCVWYLRPCIDSIFEKTDYPNFEIVIVDNQTDDPDTLAYYDELRRSRADRVSIVAYDQPFNFSAQCNLGVSVARGTFVILLNNDTEIVQENWLSRLLAHGLRPEVGVVAPRLLYPQTGRIQHAGIVLGLDRIGGLGFKNLEMTDPGYMNRLQVEQDYSAVSASCLLVSRALYHEVGGMDEAAAPLTYGDIDFCLKVRDAGKLVVWTPAVSVVHHESQSLKLEISTLAAQAVAADRDATASETLFQRWKPWIADDPAYNRHLALISPRSFQVESELVADWDKNFHERPRVLAFPPAGGVGEYRFIAPLRGLAHAGHVQSTIVQTHKYHLRRNATLAELERLDPDVLVQQFDFAPSFIEWQKAYRKHRPSMRTIVMLDDLITHTPKDHPSYQSTPRNGRQLMRQIFSNADRAIVSTEPLLQLLREFMEDVHLVPNALREDLWGHLVSLRRVGKKPRVGWAGAQQHKGDLAIIADVVKRTADSVDWIFFGMCPHEIRPYVAEFHNFEVGVEAYPAKLASLNLDLAVAPLEQHPFNEAKSNLRLLEYGILGLPVVCTDILPYRTDNAPVKRVDNDADAWTEAILERVHDLDAAATEGDVLREWVREKYMLNSHLDAWLKAFTLFT